MSDKEKIISGWKRCRECHQMTRTMANKAYADCEYVDGISCRQDRLIDETIEFLEELPERQEDKT